MNPLQKFFVDKQLMKDFETLFGQCADKLALEDMARGVDVTYVPKNKLVLKEVYKILNDTYAEKKKKTTRTPRAL